MKPSLCVNEYLGDLTFKIPGGGGWRYTCPTTCMYDAKCLTRSEELLLCA